MYFQISNIQMKAYVLYCHRKDSFFFFFFSFYFNVSDCVNTHVQKPPISRLYMTVQKIVQRLDDLKFVKREESEIALFTVLRSERLSGSAD